MLLLTMMGGSLKRELYDIMAYTYFVACVKPQTRQDEICDLLFMLAWYDLADERGQGGGQDFLADWQQKRQGEQRKDQNNALGLLISLCHDPMQEIFAKMTLYNFASLLRLHTGFMQPKGKYSYRVNVAFAAHAARKFLLVFAPAAKVGLLIASFLLPRPARPTKAKKYACGAPG